MAPIVFTFLLLFTLVNLTVSTEIDANDIAIEEFQSSGSLDDVEILVLGEAQVLNTLIELDSQLSEALDAVSSASGAMEIDVVVGELDGSKSGSGLWIDEEIVVVIPAAAQLSDDEKEEIKDEIENEVADALDAMIVDEMEVEQEAEQESEVGRGYKVERLVEKEAEAEEELSRMQDELKTALDNLPDDDQPAEIDVVVTETDNVNGQEVVGDEIVVIIPVSTGSGPRLTEGEKEELEQEIGKEAADALGAIIVTEFVGDEGIDADLTLPVAPRLEEEPPRGDALLQRTSAPFVDTEVARKDVAAEPNPALRGAAATTTAHTGLEHPMFVPRHWQMPLNEQLWTMKLSMLTLISCLTLLLIVGVWTGVRRSHRRAVLDDNHFRWAEAVEYMEAFPFDP